LLVTVADTTAAARLYQWTDERGNVTYQDHPPPENVLDYGEARLVPPPLPAKSSSEPVIAITLYTVKDCEACDLARAFLVEKGLSFSELDPEAAQTVAVQMIERFGAAEVPMQVIGNEVVKGHNPLWVESAIKKQVPADAVESAPAEKESSSTP